jgi:phosphoadenosine phosphosulfate reductase
MIELELDSKVSIGKIIIKDALKRFKSPVVVWSAGKDSTVVLDLVMKVAKEENIRVPPALFIDHGDHFQETWDMLNKYANEWNLKLVVAKNEKVINAVKDGNIKLSDIGDENITETKKIGFTGDSFPYSLDTDIGNHLLKTVAMNQTIRKYGFDALFTGIRWDENAARSTEKFFSPRENPPHTRVHPILTFRERDIWDYMFKYNLPIHPKYKEGYRSIDGIRDSTKTSDKPAWEQDLESTKERAGRSQDKEGMMEKLRKMGYM